MIRAAILGLDVASIVFALLASWFWWRASGRMVRRVEKDEELNSRDFNRIIVAMNRAQMLNERAAIASAIAAFVIALRFGVGMLPD